jgi:hypothetical protein
MSTDMLKYLSQKVNDELARMEADMSLGGAKDFSDYKYACGIIRGLRVANNILMETAERMEESDD